MSASAAGKLKVYYFAGRGRADGIRGFLNFVGADYEDVHVTTKPASEVPADWIQMSEFKATCKSAYGQVPMLELPTGECISQTLAIMTWIATTYGLAGDGSALQNAKIMEVLMGTEDLVNGLFKEIVKGSKDDYEGTMSGARVVATKFFASLEAILARNKTEDGQVPHFVGTTTTHADFHVAGLIGTMIDQDFIANLEAYPKLAALREGILANKAYSAFLADPKRPPVFSMFNLVHGA